MNLDKEIAELLGMEIRIWPDPRDPSYQETHYFKNGNFIAYFSPSRSIEQAMELLEGLGKWELFHHAEYPTTPYTCYILSDDYEGDGMTASEAICKAFIKYKEGEKK